MISQLLVRLTVSMLYLLTDYLCVLVTYVIVYKQIGYKTLLKGVSNTVTHS